jgi:hypothetical protein
MQSAHCLVREQSRARARAVGVDEKLSVALEEGRSKSGVRELRIVKGLGEKTLSIPQRKICGGKVDGNNQIELASGETALEKIHEQGFLFWIGKARRIEGRFVDIDRLRNSRASVVRNAADMALKGAM